MFVLISKNLISVKALLSLSDAHSLSDSFSDPSFQICNVVNVARSGSVSLISFP